MNARFLTLIGVGALVATSGGCSDHDQYQPAPAGAVTSAAGTPAATRPAAPPPLPVQAADPFADLAETLGRITRDQTALLTAKQDQLNQRLDAQISNWKATGGNLSGPDENKLELARTDLAQKLRALALAGETTWTSAKTEALSSLENVRQLYTRVLTRPGSP